MSHDSRWPVWIAVVLGLLAVLLAIHVATPRVRLTSGESLGQPTIRQSRKVAHHPTPLTAEGEEESFGNLSLFADPHASGPLPQP